MKIDRTLETGAYKPPCLVEVRTSKTVETRTLAYRKYQMKRRGLPDTACGGRATYLVDGVAMCDRHAAQAALKHVLENQHGTR